jgi:hypothetical protein
MTDQPPTKKRIGRPRGTDASLRKPTVPIDKSLLGPMMAALPNDRWRAAAVARFMAKSNTAAIIAAGFSSSPASRQTAYNIFHDERMLRALRELGEKHLVNGIPDAIGAVEEILADKDHKDRLRAAQTLLDRAYPLTTHQHLTVEHIDHDAEAVAQLRILKGLGVAPEKLEQIFGVNGITKFERLLALEDGKRADAARVIDADAEVSS